jgi:hypothetical protein
MEFSVFICSENVSATLNPIIHQQVSSLPLEGEGWGGGGVIKLLRQADATLHLPPPLKGRGANLRQKVEDDVICCHSERSEESRIFKFVIAFQTFIKNPAKV